MPAPGKQTIAPMAEYRPFTKPREDPLSKPG